MSDKPSKKQGLEEVSLDYDPRLPMSKLKVAEENVRKHARLVGIEDLKNSIRHLGLLQPIIVKPKGDRFEVVVGQRRFEAVKELGWPTIKALIIGARADSRALMMLSFSENIHRRNLPYDDTIEVCTRLFSDYTGSKTERIRKIAADLGISHGTVKKYLAHQLVPKEVRQMVSEAKMPATLAERITNAFWPNDKRIIAVAKDVRKDLTDDEFERLLDLGATHPEMGLGELQEEAKKPPKDVDVTITISAVAKKWYEAEAVKRRTTFKQLVREAIDDYMESEKVS